MVDPVSISAMVVAILAALSSFVVQAHLKRCQILGSCVKSDCTKVEGSEPDTPIEEPPVKMHSPAPRIKNAATTDI